MTNTEFQDFLDRISTCFIAEDFAAWRSAVLLPLTLVTARGSETFASATALRGNFGQYLTACRVLALDQIYRRPVALERCRDGLWLGTYETNLLRRGERAIEPYTSTALLHELWDGIRLSSILNARGHYDWTDAVGPGP